VPGALRRPTRHLRRGAPLQRRTRRSRGAGPALPPIRRNPRGVRLTFEAPSKRRTGVSGSPIPLRPFAGPWGLPPPRRPRPIARPTRLASLAFASPPRLSLEAACRASSFRAPRDAPLLGFPALQHMPDPRVHLRGGSEFPATFRPQGFDPLAGFLPASPPGPVSCRSAPGLRPSGVSSSGTVGASHEARHPHDVGCPPAVHFAAERNARNRPRAPQARPRGFPFPESGCPGRLFASRRSPLPSWASSSLRPAIRPPHRPDLAAIPPWASGRPSSLRPAVAPALRGLRRRAA
jgi:hypothetical protein